MCFCDVLLPQGTEEPKGTTMVRPRFVLNFSDVHVETGDH